MLPIRGSANQSTQGEEENNNQQVTRGLTRKGCLHIKDRRKYWKQQPAGHVGANEERMLTY